MSRIGKQPIAIPTGVTITVGDSEITVRAPKVHSTSHSAQHHYQGRRRQIIVTRKDDEANSKAWHGLQRSLLIMPFKA